MNSSKRNPLLRNNMVEFNKIIGSLGEEIQEQNLDEINGGTSLPCLSVQATIIATASTLECAAATLASVYTVSKVTNWASNKVTNYFGC